MTTVYLGDLVKIRGGGTPDRKYPNYWGGEIPWATVKDFVAGELSFTQEHITKDGLIHSATNLIPAGNIIIPTRMALGKVAVNTIDVTINQDLKALFVKDPSKLERDYLVRFIQSQSSFIESQGTGATVKGITLEVLNGLKVPLPPLTDQKRIVAILDKADSIRRKRHQTIGLAGEFLRGVFLDMFGNPVTNLKGLPTGTIRHLVTEATRGAAQKTDKITGQLPLLTERNITHQGEWDFDCLKYIDLSGKNPGKYLVRNGDLLFDATNRKKLVAKTAVFDRSDNMAFSSRLIRLRTNLDGNPYYLSGYLNSNYGKQVLQGICKKTAGMANINAEEIQDIKLLIPPIESQDKYGAIVQALYKRSKHHRTSLKEMNVLFDSLSQRAFLGRL